MRRIQTRMVILFLTAAFPALLASVVAVVTFDRLIEREIAVRSNRILGQVKGVVQDERRSIESKLSLLLESDALRTLAASVDDPNAAGQAETLASERAVALGLDILGIARVGAKDAGDVLSSAHLPMSVGDPAPAFVLAATTASTSFGFAHEIVEANPPVIVPALIAVRALSSTRKRARLVAYAGSRLDGKRLDDLARMADATLVLRSPGLAERRFPQGGEVRFVAGRALAAVELDELTRGRELNEVPSDSSTPSRTQLEVVVHTTGLERARRTFMELAAWLAVASLVTGYFASRVVARRITRPIVELSTAARRVASGDLDVSVKATTDDEIGSLVGVFNDMTRELSESRERIQRAERIAAWREVARRVAHEIKNPLFPIQMAMETLRKSYAKHHDKLGEILEESTKTVLEEVRALNRIVTEFSEFARLPSPRRAATSCVELVDHVYSLFAGDPRVVSSGRSAIGERELPSIFVDRDQVARALINLVKNAVEALPIGGGTVVLDAVLEKRRGREGVSFIVSDTGAGMPAEIRAKIFAPYFTTKTEGTGLGLAIVDRIVAEHGGEIEVDSTPGEGSRFRVWFEAG